MNEAAAATARVVQAPSDRALQAVPPPRAVPAKLCCHGHPNDPEAQVCWICEESIAVAAEIVERIPGTLARLLLEDGTAIDVADDLMIGRSPVSEGLRATLTIGGRQVSRRHLVLEIRGWQIYVRDYDSTNGTFLSRRGEKGRRRVPVEHAIPLRIGESIHFGSRQALVARPTKTGQPDS